MMGQPIEPLLDATEVAVELLRHKAGFEDVGVAVLAWLAQAVRCEWGVYWTLDPPSQHLRAVAIWSALGDLGEHFERDTRTRTLAPHVGNAWHVWRSRRPIWATDLMLEMCLPRSLKALQAGLQAGVWFGVQTDTVVHGVVEPLARTLPYRKYETLQALQRVGLRLGGALEEGAVPPLSSLPPTDAGERFR